jgi:hypothetical protein
MQGDSGGFSLLLFVGILVWALWPGSGDGWNDRLWYSLKFGVSYDQVHIAAKPKDCDFMHAPLGDKGCYFQAIVAARNATGAVVAGDNAPQWNHLQC